MTKHHPLFYKRLFEIMGIWDEVQSESAGIYDWVGAQPRKRWTSLAGSFVWSNSAKGYKYWSEMDRQMEVLYRQLSIEAMEVKPCQRREG